MALPLWLSPPQTGFYDPDKMLVLLSGALTVGIGHSVAFASYFLVSLILPYVLLDSALVYLPTHCVLPLLIMIEKNGVYNLLKFDQIIEFLENHYKNSELFAELCHKDGDKIKSALLEPANGEYLKMTTGRIADKGESIFLSIHCT